MIKLSNKVIVQFFLPFPKIIEKIFKFWLKWSNFYQWMERKFLKTDKSLLKKYIGAYSPFNEWKKYLEKLDVQYSSDKWYMGFDVCSAPERVVVRKGADCDDFALLSYSFFGDTISYMTEHYIFQEFNSLVFESGEGHVIAIWKNVDKNEYLVVSNNDIMITENINSDWQSIMESNLLYVGSFKLDINQKLTFISFKIVGWLI